VTEQPIQPAPDGTELARPASGWTQPAPSSAPVPGAPGFVFSSTARRFVAWFIDSLLVLFIYLFPIGVLDYAGVDLNTTAAQSLESIIAVAVSFAYFIVSWRSRGRATIGQRMFKIQVGNAFDGRTLTVRQSVIRWASLGYPVGLLGIAPSLGSLSSLLQLIWQIVLLFSTALSPTKQGLHDRWANSAVVSPEGASSSGLAVALIVIIVILAVPVLAILALLFLGTQISTILSTVSNSV
jgi:uncharacterized RDD family membrane protein YckC